MSVLNTVELYISKWWISCSVYFATIKKERIWGEEKNRTKITNKIKSPSVTSNCPFPSHRSVSSPPFPKCMIMLSLSVYTETLSSVSFRSAFLTQCCMLFRTDLHHLLNLANNHIIHLQCRNVSTLWMPMFLLKWLRLSQKVISVEHTSGNQEDCGIVFYC